MHINLKTKYYFINKFNANIIDKQDSKTVIIYRNYSQKINKSLIIKINNYCKKKGNKFFVANDIKLAIELNLDGVYIPSFNKSLTHLNYSIPKDFNIIGSAHNLQQIRNKEIQKVNKIFISSLFKKNNNFLGINKFKLLSSLTKKKIVVLGGISKRNIKFLKLLNYDGFAGISFFE